MVTSEVEMSADIRSEAGELADRDMLPLSWAVPLSTTQDRGQFWAFFPTSTGQHSGGILNAPWKTNADRQNLLESDFNDRLIERAASMVVDQLSSLSTAEDPARHLDYLPGRGREAPQWADALVTYHVYEMCRYSPSLPDLDGTMTMPEELRVHPANLGAAAVELFASVSRERDWVHPSAEVRNRRGRVDKIVEDLGHRPPTVEAWFGSLCYPDLSVEESGMVARLASLIAEKKGFALLRRRRLSSPLPGIWWRLTPHRSSSVMGPRRRMALRWCTRRSKLTLRCALRWSRLVFAPSMPLAGLMRCSHRPMGSPKRRGRSSGG